MSADADVDRMVTEVKEVVGDAVNVSLAVRRGVITI
jgi:hypothetical protein